MPMSEGFSRRLLPRLPELVEQFGTPFHIYDEQGILDTGEDLKQAFAWHPDFQEFFSVKALPNPAILKIIQRLGFGFDCSSTAELHLSRLVGAQPGDIMFTSNNTGPAEFAEFFNRDDGILNLDDITMLDRLPRVPELLFFRYNPGPRRQGNEIIGDPVAAKFGVRHDQIIPAYRRARVELGVKRFGLHTMVCSNVLDYAYMVDTVKMLLELATEINTAAGIRIEAINIGGGIGIPYRPEQARFNLTGLADEARRLFEAFQRKNGYLPHLYMELGRYLTGPHGVLVTRVLNRMSKYREYVGVDAAMSSLMRPAMYGAYHHITVPGRDSNGKVTCDVVGSLCENNDKFAVQRELPETQPGDLLVIHDSGAHGHAMGFNYNGKLRPQELLLGTDATVKRIRRAETLEDYFATLKF